MNILNGLFFGLILQLGIGPVNIATWIYGIVYGWKKSFLISVGVAIADLFYIITSLYILKGLMGIKYFEVIITIISALMLFYMGLKSIYKKTDIKQNTDNTFIFEGNLIKSGFLINIVNPKAIILWVTVLSVFPNIDIIFAIGIPLSTIIWLGIIPLFINFFIKSFGDNFQEVLITKLRLNGKYLIGTVFIVYGFIVVFKLLNI